jgi:hypothetical protein
MLTPDVVAKVAKMCMDKNTGQLEGLADLFGNLYKESKELQTLLGRFIYQVVVDTLSGDITGVAAGLLTTLSIGYRLRTTEELEELANK